MKTALYEKHLEAGAKMIDFGGWEMPLQYQGILQEHQAVRNRAGIFDVSHMGVVDVAGKDAEPFLDFLSTNRIAGKEDGTATYTVWANEAGGCVDDVIIFKRGPESFFVVVNASNREKDLNHLLESSSGFDVRIKERYDEIGILAVQGPEALTYVAELFPEVENLPPMRFRSFEFEGEEAVVSTTGYTGEKGVEIYASPALLKKLWDLLTGSGVEPIGLGARDTLRLEKGFALYGHELADTISPVETVSRWTVKLKKERFLGKEKMEQLVGSEKKRTEKGVVLLDKGVAREGYEVFKNGTKIGSVTSGTFSPTLNRAIAIVLIEGELEPDEELEIQVRNSRCKAKVVKLPFV